MGQEVFLESVEVLYKLQSAMGIFQNNVIGIQLGAASSANSIRNECENKISAAKQECDRAEMEVMDAQRYVFAQRDVVGGLESNLQQKGEELAEIQERCGDCERRIAQYQASGPDGDHMAYAEEQTLMGLKWDMKKLTSQMQDIEAACRDARARLEVLREEETKKRAEHEQAKQRHEALRTAFQRVERALGNYQSWINRAVGEAEAVAYSDEQTLGRCIACIEAYCAVKL